MGSKNKMGHKSGPGGPNWLKFYVVVFGHHTYHLDHIWSKFATINGDTSLV